LNFKLTIRTELSETKPEKSAPAPLVFLDLDEEEFSGENGRGAECEAVGKTAVPAGDHSVLAQVDVCAVVGVEAAVVLNHRGSRLTAIITVAPAARHFLLLLLICKLK